MFERFTDRARRVVVLAQEEARLLNHSYIGTEHLLLGLIAEGEGVGAVALRQLGVELHATRDAINEMIGASTGTSPAGHIPFTPRSKRVLELALREGVQLGHNYIGTEHILLGLIAEGDGVAAQILIRRGLTLADVRAEVIQILTSHGLPASPPAGGWASTPGDSGTHKPLSPGLRDALEAATALASDGTVGSQHVLAVFDAWDDLAAHAALRTGGFDSTALDVHLAQWPVAGTRDETPEQWGARVADITTDEGAVVIRLTDDALRDQIANAIEQGLGAQVAADLGRLLKDLRVIRGSSVSEAGHAAEAPAAGGDEDDEEQGGADEDDGGA